MSSRLGRIFVSSVFQDFLDRRKQVKEAAQLLGMEAVLSEDFVAHPGAVGPTLEQQVASCDIYLGLFATQRGSLPYPEAQRAITEEEFLMATRHGLRRLVFIAREKEAKRDPELKEFIKRQVSDYQKGVWAVPFQDDSDLDRQMAAALSWVRPRAILWLNSNQEGHQARLRLEGLAPAWEGQAVLGPEEADLDLSPTAGQVWELFLRGAESRLRLKEEGLLLAGAELWQKALPGELGKALRQLLQAARADSRLLVLEVESDDPDVLALPWEWLQPPLDGEQALEPFPVRGGLLEVVRRIPHPSGSESSLPSVPGSRFSLLGFTADPLQDHAAQVRLGASGGLGEDSSLFWEKEQEILLGAVEPLFRQGRARLVLPDSGDKEVLRRQLAREDRPAVLHLSCHGGPEKGEKGLRHVVYLEDGQGLRSAVGSEELLRWMRAGPGGNPPELVLLSACYTATRQPGGAGAAGHKAPASRIHPEGRSGSLAEELLRGGAPRVLGMQTSISDAGAIRFAEAFYGQLARGADAVWAMRKGRVALEEGSEHEWSIPLLLASGHWGPLTAPLSRQAEGQAQLEAPGEAFRIAGVSYLEHGYVGRRHFERRLEACWQANRPLVAIHGLGGIGKSTLAARFLQKRQAEGVRVLTAAVGPVEAASLWEELAKAVGVSRPSRMPPQAAEKMFRQLLAEKLQQPTTVLLFDNFEDNQDQDGACKAQELAEALLDLAGMAAGRLRLLFTSRRPFQLPEGQWEAINLDLGELSRAGTRKFKMLHEGLRGLGGEQWQKALLNLGGHPKALELLSGYLEGNPDRARQMVDRFPALEVDRRLKGRQARGRELLVDEVISQVPQERLATLDRLSLLQTPLPAPLLEELLRSEGLADPGGDIAWLRQRGLLAQALSAGTLSGGDFVHRLIASRRQEELATREGEEKATAFHMRAAELLVQEGMPLSHYGLAAFHHAAAGDRAGALKLYANWSLTLRDRHAYRACLQIVERGLEVYPPGQDNAAQVQTGLLHIFKHDGLVPLGELQQAGRELDQAEAILEKCSGNKAEFHRAGVAMHRARLLLNTGKARQAEACLEQAREGFRESGHPREAAIALGDIVRLKAQAGDLDGAKKMQQERLEVNRKLGDTDGIGAALWDLAQLDMQKDDYQSALPRLGESWKLFLQLGRADAIAVIGETLGGILADNRHPDASIILSRARDAWRLLGQEERAGRIEEALKDLPPAEPEGRNRRGR